MIKLITNTLAPAVKETRLTIDAIVLATTVGGGWIACGADRTRPLVVWFDLPPAIVTIHFLIAFLLAGAAVDRSMHLFASAGYCNGKAKHVVVHFRTIMKSRHHGA
ncbi:hypothetical protein [Geobacillus thermoleovorans]|uniref:hypothetical protein n=1 Tax=Geobacillus thermoleovorans TaxID=33941 RepID=UPI0014302B9B